jgi:hypothetical protein
MLYEKIKAMEEYFKVVVCKGEGTVKQVSDFPVHSRDVTYHTLLAGNNLTPLLPTVFQIRIGSRFNQVSGSGSGFYPGGQK